MTDPNIPVTEDELHAYVDNELPAERRGDVEAWLLTHPDEAATLGRQGLVYVEREYRWPVVMARVEGLREEVSARRRR